MGFNKTQKKLKISALQMSSMTGDVAANRKNLSEIINKELNKDTDLLILPEVWTVGWSCEDFVNSAEDILKSETINLLSAIAKKYNMNIIGGSFIEKTPVGNYYNTCPVINRKGELIAKYSKMHLYSYCGCTEGTYITKGEHPVLVNIDGIKTGLTICYDIRFPEIYRAYRALDADLLINVAAWGSKKPIPWETLTRARAIENQAYMVALTQSGQINNHEWNIGHSRIFDYLGETVTEIKDQNEGIMSCEIDFGTMYEYREICPVMKDMCDKYEVSII